MSSRASPAVLPDPKRPRLLASGDETSSTPAVPSAAPSTFTSANYPNLVPTPIQAVATHGRSEWQATPRTPPPQHRTQLMMTSVSASSLAPGHADGVEQLITTEKSATTRRSGCANFVPSLVVNQLKPASATRVGPPSDRRRS
jgi:hypothetical protein